MPAINGHIPQSYGSAGSLLRLDGVDCGFVTAMGGWAYGEVVEEPPGADNVVGKHLGGVRYEDIVLGCTDPPDRVLADWIDQTLSGQPTTHNGEIVAFDLSGKERSRLSFHTALIGEITVPALDATSKDALRLGVRLAPEWTRREVGSGVKAESVSARQKSWLANNFRLSIDGLDCTQVSRVEQLVARRVFTADPAGNPRLQQAPSHLEVPDLVVTLSEASAGGWFAWHEDHVITGRNTEKNATLEFLAPDSRTVLASLSFSGLGIYRVAENTFTAGREVIARVQATMYCERLSLHGPGATASQSIAGSSAPGAPPPSGVAPPPSRTDVIAPLGDSLSQRLTARRELLGQLRTR